MFSSNRFQNVDGGGRDASKMIGIYVKQIAYAAFVKVLFDLLYLIGILPVIIEAFIALCVVKGRWRFNKNVMHVLIGNNVISHRTIVAHTVSDI